MLLIIVKTFLMSHSRKMAESLQMEAGSKAATNFMESFFADGVSDRRFSCTEYHKFHSVVGKNENTLIFTLPAQPDCEYKHKYLKKSFNLNIYYSKNISALGDRIASWNKDCGQRWK